MSTSSWLTCDTSEATDRLLGLWPDAPVENLELTGMLLDVAQEQVLAFAPAAPDGADWTSAPPARFVLAQRQQAQNLWNAGRATPEVGPEEFSFTPRPLDKTIRTIIRPIDGKPDAF
ncbi:hypothetical protein [Leifsonia aquatica]|uniref:hypothetical protein n=1 Tax=Leifsonia aquatica TaxID=144185 RepID=UPI00046AE174|nr:hypothetical protein [Leifsonia aquatica]